MGCICKTTWNALAVGIRKLECLNENCLNSAGTPAGSAPRPNVRAGNRAEIPRGSRPGPSLLEEAERPGSKGKYTAGSRGGRLCGGVEVFDIYDEGYIRRPGLNLDFGPLHGCSPDPCRRETVRDENGGR